MLGDLDMGGYSIKNAAFVGGVDDVLDGIPVSIRKYGAVGDGATDDTQAFLDAFADINAGNVKALFLNQGTYIVNDTLEIKVNSVSINGDGVGVTEIKRTDGTFGDTIRIAKANLTTEILGVSITNLTLHCAAEMDSGAAIHLQTAGRIFVNTVFLKNYFKGIWTEGIRDSHFDHTEMVTGEFHTVDYTASCHCHIGPSADPARETTEVSFSNFNWTTNGNEGDVYNSVKIDGNVDGIWFNNGHWFGGKLSGCNIDGDGSPQLQGITFNHVWFDQFTPRNLMISGETTDPDKYRHISFKNCRFFGGSEYNILVDQSSNIGNVIFTGCEVGLTPGQGAIIGAGDISFLACSFKGLNLGLDANGYAIQTTAGASVDTKLTVVGSDFDLTNLKYGIQCVKEEATYNFGKNVFRNHGPALSAEILLDGDGEWSTQDVANYPLERRIATGVSLGGALTPIVGSFDHGKNLVVIYRVATTHDEEDGATANIIRSADWGKTWSAPEVLVSEATVDIRNFGGGNTADSDTMVFFYGRAGTGAGPVSVIKSTDKGTTWGAPQVLTLPAEIGNGNAYGKLAIFGTTLIQSIYGGDSLAVAKSTNNGTTWVCSLQYEPADAPDPTASLTETAIIPLSATEGVGIVRDNSGTHKNALHFYTDDAGATWSALTDTGIELGMQPPTLFEKGGNTYLLYPNRPQESGKLYQTGDFTPTVAGQDVHGSHVYTRQIGKYIQVGALRTVFIEIIIASLDWDVTAAGTLRVKTGLTLGDAAYGQIPVTIGTIQTVTDGGVSTTDTTQVVGFLAAGSNEIQFHLNRMSSSIQPLLAENVSNITMKLTYQYPIPVGRGDLNNGKQWLYHTIKDNQHQNNEAWSSVDSIPLYLPYLGSGINGDSGYGFVVEIQGKKMMFHYKGTYSDNGSDLLMSNIGGLF
jgi:hypothetical protein